MSTTTPNRGLKKAQSGDDVEQTAVQDYAGNFDNLDTHTHPASDISGIATQTGLDAEATTRATADTTEATARASGDSAEATARAAADTVEASARATADTAEATTRAAADTTNASNLTSHTGATGTAVHGLGTMSTQAASGVAITGGTISGITALGVPAGGTGAGTLTGLVKGNGTSALTAVTAPTGAVVGTTDSQTLTNKTLTSPLGIVKGDVGLGNVVNSDATNATNLASGTVAPARMGSGTPSNANWLRGDGAWGAPGALFALRWAVDADWANNFTFVSVTGLGTNSYTRTAPAVTSTRKANAVLVHLGRVTSAGADGNERLLAYATAVGDLANSDCLLETQARVIGSSGSRPQTGVFHRLQNIGGASTQVAYIAWIDSIFGQDDLINVGIWKGATTATFAQGSGGSATMTNTMESLSRWKDVYTVALTTNVATWTIEGGHGYVVGDQITVEACTASTFNVTGATLTGVTPTTVTASVTHADIGSAAAGTGARIKDISRVLPIKIRSRLVGTTMFVKVWRSSDPEPSWSDPNANMVWNDAAAQGPTTGSGKCGIATAHIGNGGILDVGSVDITPL